MPHNDQFVIRMKIKNGFLIYQRPEKKLGLDQ